MSTRPSFEQNYQALGASGDSGHDRIQVWYDSLQARSYSVLRGGWTRWFFKRNEKRPDLVIIWMFPGQNLEQTWNSGTDQVHKNDHNMALQLLRPSIPAYQ